MIDADATPTARPGLRGRADTTREAILVTAERLFAEYGVFAVSNRQISEAAGQGNNAAVGYHFGTKTDLIRAIVAKHAVHIDQIRRELLAELGTSTDLRDWVTCAVRPVTDHLASLGVPTWYARFAAQLMTDPALRRIAVGDALTAPAIRVASDGLNRCLPDLPSEVRAERADMIRALVVHTCAERERALADGDPPCPDWAATAASLIDATAGLLLSPVTRA